MHGGRKSRELLQSARFRFQVCAQVLGTVVDVLLILYEFNMVGHSVFPENPHVLLSGSRPQSPSPKLYVPLLPFIRSEFVACLKTLGFQGQPGDAY